MGEFSLIGKPVSRVDALEKVTGRAKYGTYECLYDNRLDFKSNV